MTIEDLLIYVRENKLESLYIEIMSIANEVGLEGSTIYLLMTYVVNECLKKEGKTWQEING